jgi:hypothetical protein
MIPLQGTKVGLRHPLIRPNGNIWTVDVVESPGSTLPGMPAAGPKRRNGGEVSPPFRFARCDSAYHWTLVPMMNDWICTLLLVCVSVPPLSRLTPPWCDWP